MPFTQATRSQTFALAREYYKLGTKPDDAYKQLVDAKYTHQGLKYHGRTVEIILRTLNAINGAVKSGDIKCTKRGGLQL